jgi:hypothetical protein
VHQGGLFDGNSTSTSAIYEGSGSGLILPDGVRIDSGALVDSEWSDKVSIDGKFTIPHYPFGILKNSSTYQNVLGLGRNSSFLNALLNTQRAGARRWALFMGWTGDSLDTQLNGSLISDGYDLAKMDRDSLLTQTLITNNLCPSGLIIALADVLINYSNGTSESLMDGTGLTDQNACISLDYPLLDMSGAIWNNFINAAGGPPAFINSTSNASTGAASTGIFAGGMLAVADNVYVVIAEILYLLLTFFVGFKRT